MSGKQVDPDQMLHSAASDLDLLFALVCLFSVNKVRNLYSKIKDTCPIISLTKGHIQTF